MGTLWLSIPYLLPICKVTVQGEGGKSKHITKERKPDCGDEIALAKKNIKHFFPPVTFPLQIFLLLLCIFGAKTELGILFIPPNV